MSDVADADPNEPAVWGGQHVGPGQHAAVEIAVGASYSGADIRLPVFVWRGLEPGPTVSVTAAVHGDEINGTGAIRYLITHRPFTLASGTLVLVPVVNLPGFEQHARYLPDRRDLNRCFPGNAEGSLASRLVLRLFLSFSRSRNEKM